MSDLKMVSMNDGRNVAFGVRMKRKTEVLEGGLKVRFDFPNGETRTVDVMEFPEAERSLLLGHGVSQKIGDECANLDTVDECIVAVDAMIARLQAGTGFARQGGGGFIDATLIAALVELGADREAATQAVKAMTSAERLAVRADDAVKPIIQRLEAEKAKGADVGSILGKLGIQAV